MRTCVTRLVSTRSAHAPARRPRAPFALLASALAVALALGGGTAWLVGPALDAGAHADADAEAAPDAGGAEDKHLGAVVGRVRDGDGNGVEGLLVRIAARDLSTHTGPEGNYRFYSVPAGPVVVTVEVAGDAVSQRLVQVSEGVVHEINLRIGESRSSPHALVLHYEGRVSCTLVAAGAPVACADEADHVVNVTGPWRYAIVDVTWADASTPLNVTAALDPERDPVTRRPVAPHATEGADPLRLVVPLDADAPELVVRARPASDATSGPVDVPYALTVTLLPHAPDA